MKVHPQLNSCSLCTDYQSGRASTMSGQSHSKTHGPLLTVAHVSLALSVSERTVRRLLASGELSVVRLGRSVRVRQLDLDAYIGRQLHAGGR